LAVGGLAADFRREVQWLCRRSWMNPWSNLTYIGFVVVAVLGPETDESDV
jgi:hypothetical protein